MTSLLFDSYLKISHSLNAFVSPTYLSSLVSSFVGESVSTDDIAITASYFGRAAEFYTSLLGEFYTSLLGVTSPYYFYGVTYSSIYSGRGRLFITF